MNERSEGFTELENRAKRQGEVRVIVLLDVPGRADRSRSDSQVRRRRSLIRTAQNEVLDALEAETFELVHRYRGPMLALNLSPGALRVLEGHPRVRHVRLDRPAEPLESSSPSHTPRSETSS